ncbi:MAG: hypothetical protein JXR95_14105 [Deltaproteobacteria bacterium]|nr:hypothetical protein [Deltaproteobacteria bacterium]
MNLLIVFVSLINIIPANKKSLYYYYHYNHKKKNAEVPLRTDVEKNRLGAFAGSGDGVLNSFELQMKLRARILSGDRSISMSEVNTLYNLDPESLNGNFFQLLFKSIKGLTSGNEKFDLSDFRYSYLKLLSSFMAKDYRSTYHILLNSNSSYTEDLLLSFHIGKRFLANSMLYRAYNAMRKSLRNLENSYYSTGLNRKEKVLLYTETVLYLAQISIIEGNYRRAFGILRWLKVNTMKSPGFLRIKCEWAEEFSGSCKEEKTVERNEILFLTEKSQEDSDFHRCLRQWSLDWNSGVHVWKAFLSRNSGYRYKSFVEKFIFWLKHNPATAD